MKKMVVMAAMLLMFGLTAWAVAQSELERMDQRLEMRCQGSQCSARDLRQKMR